MAINLELPITANIDSELDSLERLRRIGDMKAAREFFRHNLEVHMPNDLYVFVKYAELLLDMGDYKAVVALTNHKDCELTAAPTTDAGNYLSRPAIFYLFLYQAVADQTSRIAQVSTTPSPQLALETHQGLGKKFHRQEKQCRPRGAGRTGLFSVRPSPGTSRGNYLSVAEGDRLRAPKQEMDGLM